MSTLNNWTNKNIIITGGTSGLGLELAGQFSKLGARVGVVGRDDQRLAIVEVELGVKGFPADVSDRMQIYPLAGLIQANFPQVDLLIHCASSLGDLPLRLLADTDCESFEQVLQTNLLGPFRLTKALLPSMIVQENCPSLVVNISSDAAVNPYPKWGAYSVSKAALDHMSQIFDEELRDLGVRFVAVDPGDMRTPMHFAAVPNADPEALHHPRESARKLIERLQELDPSDSKRDRMKIW